MAASNVIYVRPWPIPADFLRCRVNLRVTTAKPLSALSCVAGSVRNTRALAVTCMPASINWESGKNSSVWTSIPRGGMNSLYRNIPLALISRVWPHPR